MIMYSVLQVLLGLPLCSFNFKHVVLLLMPLHAAQEQNMSKQKYTSQGSVVVHSRHANGGENGVADGYSDDVNVLQEPAELRLDATCLTKCHFRAGEHMEGGAAIWAYFI